MKAPISGTHQITYDAIFQHPVGRNVHWTEVRSLLAAMGDVVESGAQLLKVTRNGQKLVLHRPQRNVVAVKELMDIRRFLERSEAPPSQSVAEGSTLPKDDSIA